MILFISNAAKTFNSLGLILLSLLDAIKRYWVLPGAKHYISTIENDSRTYNKVTYFLSVFNKNILNEINEWVNEWMNK